MKSNIVGNNYDNLALDVGHRYLQCPVCFLQMFENEALQKGAANVPLLDVPAVVSCVADEKLLRES
eukprot:1772774-Pyramimonas_sp.AAC.1